MNKLIRGHRFFEFIMNNSKGQSDIVLTHTSLVKNWISIGWINVIRKNERDDTVTVEITELGHTMMDYSKL